MGVYKNRINIAHIFNLFWIKKVVFVSKYTHYFIYLYTTPLPLAAVVRCPCYNDSARLIHQGRAHTTMSNIKLKRSVVLCPIYYGHKTFCPTY